MILIASILAATMAHTMHMTGPVALIMTPTGDKLSNRFRDEIDGQFNQSIICEEQCVMAELLPIRSAHGTFRYEVRVQRIADAVRTVFVHDIRGVCAVNEVRRCAKRVADEIGAVGPTLPLSRSAMPKVQVIER